MISIDVAATSGMQILTGVAFGRRAFEALQKRLIECVPEAPIVLNFAGVEVLGGSALRYLAQSIRGTANCARSVIVLANLSEANKEEAELVADALRVPFIFADYVNGALRNSVLYGNLDEKVGRALALVISAGEADAQKISELSQESAVVTVWNNRLVALQAMGLLHERKVGKRKFYSPVIGDLRYGS